MIHGNVELPKHLEYILKHWGQDSVIAGSYPLSLLYDFKPNDVDIFTSVSIAIRSLLNSWDWTCLSETGSEGMGKTFLYIKPGELPINVIQRADFSGRSRNGRDLLDCVYASFDLSCCEIGIYWEDGEARLYSSEDWDKYSPNMTIKNPDWGRVGIFSDAERKTWTRIHKYAKRGFKRLEESRPPSCWWKLVPKKDSIKILFNGRYNTKTDPYNEHTYPINTKDTPTTESEGR